MAALFKDGLDPADNGTKKAKASHVWERDPHDWYEPTRAIDVGTAGEHIVCADIILRGHRAYMVSAGLPYDLIADVDGKLVRVTVKSTMRPRPRCNRPGSREVYQFSVGRSKRDHTGKTSQKAYTTADVDLVALVAFDSRQVAYLAMRECPTSIHFEAPNGAPRKTRFGPSRAVIRFMADYPLEQALQRLEASDAP